MAARTPEELDVLFARAVNAGDIEAMIKLYEPGACLMPEPGRVVSGTKAVLVHRTRYSNLRVAVGMDHVIEGPEGFDVTGESDEDQARISVTTVPKPRSLTAMRP